MDAESDAIEIPYLDLSADALRGVIESVILREGTDYGEREFSLEEKVAHIMARLRRREARILYDPITESIDIVDPTHRPTTGSGLKSP